jgi:hypothetical protein
VTLAEEQLLRREFELAVAARAAGGEVVVATGPRPSTPRHANRDRYNVAGLGCRSLCRLEFLRGRIVRAETIFGSVMRDSSLLPSAYTRFLRLAMTMRQVKLCAHKLISWLPFVSLST